MRRADVIAVGLIILVAASLVPPWILRQRELAYGTKPHHVGMVAVDRNNFEAEVTTSTKPVLIVFYAGGFNPLEKDYWKALTERNTEGFKTVGVPRGSRIWTLLNGTSENDRVFLWCPRIGRAVPLDVIGNLREMEAQIYGAIDLIEQPRQQPPAVGGLQI